MHFLWVNVTFYDAVNMINDVITAANPFPDTVNFTLSVLEIIKLKKSDVEEYVHIVAVYIKYLTRLGGMITFSPRLEIFQFSQPR